MTPRFFGTAPTGIASGHSFRHLQPSGALGRHLPIENDAVKRTAKARLRGRAAPHVRTPGGFPCISDATHHRGPSNEGRRACHLCAIN